jgi:hypothetical protein
LHTTLKSGSALLGILASSLMLMGCTVQVSERNSGRNSDVEIRTPAGRLSVRGLDDARETGLPPYPNAWPASNWNDRDGANVNISTAWFGIKVAAATFESDDEPAQIVAFYREAMRRYGEVTECRGDVKFRGRAQRPTCREDSSSRGVELMVGSEDNRRIVAVKPHGDYTEFALVYVSTRD